MRITRFDRETAVYVLNWTDLEKLISYIKQELPSISISISSSDKLERYFSDIEEFKSYRNSQRSSIKELHIVAKNTSMSDRVSIILNDDKNHNIRFSIDANEKIAIKLNNYFTDFLDSIRPWYSWISRTDWYLIVFIIAIFVHITNFTILTYQNSERNVLWPENGIPAGMLATAAFEVLFISLLPLAVGLALTKLKNIYFPTGVFAIGDGENRHSRNEVVRTVIIAALSISILSSFIVTWVQ